MKNKEEMNTSISPITKKKIQTDEVINFGDISGVPSIHNISNISLTGGNLNIVQNTESSQDHNAEDGDVNIHPDLPLDSNPTLVKMESTKVLQEINPATGEEIIQPEKKEQVVEEPIDLLLLI